MTEVALLRAINVGGRSVVRMTDLRDMFVAAGCRNVRTYIQSGNVIFEAPANRTAALQKVRARLRAVLGVEPDILFRDLREIEALVARPPFKGVQAGPRVKLYVAFLSRAPRRKPTFPLVSTAEAVEAVGIRNRDVFIVSRQKKNGFFGFPNNFIEDAFDVAATTRNWSTVTKIVEFARREL